MKKLFSLVLLLILICAALSVWAEGTADITGTWNMIRYIVGDRVIEDPVAAGSAKTIVFYDDGNALVTINENAYSAKWTMEGDRLHLLYDDGDSADFVVESEQLVYTTGDQVQYFAPFIDETALEALAEDGYNYLYGKNGREQDFEKAFYALLQAAEGGNAKAMFYLGYMYEEGVNADEDRIFAEGVDPAALPESVKKNVHVLLANMWYNRAREAGYALRTVLKLKK